MDFVLRTEGDTVVVEGVTVLAYRLEYPSFEGRGAARAQRDVGAMLADVRTLIAALAARGRQEYAESADPHRRFRFAPYRLTLRYLPSLADARYLSFAIRLSVGKGARELRSWTFGSTYRRVDGGPLSVGYFRAARERRAHGPAFSLTAGDEVRFWDGVGRRKKTTVGKKTQKKCPIALYKSKKKRYND